MSGEWRSSGGAAPAGTASSPAATSLTSWRSALCGASCGRPASTWVISKRPPHGRRRRLCDGGGVCDGGGSAGRGHQAAPITRPLLARAGPARWSAGYDCPSKRTPAEARVRSVECLEAAGRQRDQDQPTTPCPRGPEKGLGQRQRRLPAYEGYTSDESARVHDQYRPTRPTACADLLSYRGTVAPRRSAACPGPSPRRFPFRDDRGGAPLAAGLAERFAVIAFVRE